MAGLLCRFSLRIHKTKVSHRLRKLLLNFAVMAKARFAYHQYNYIFVAACSNHSDRGTQDKRTGRQGVNLGIICSRKVGQGKRGERGREDRGTWI